MNLDLLKKTYAGKRVLLTGHTGFKGSWLLQWLHLLGAEVMGISLPAQGPDDLYHHIDGEQLCDSRMIDIRDAGQLAEAITGFQPDFVFHLAAQPLVKRSYAIPAETFAVNVQGTVHVLDAVRLLSGPCVVVLITTDKVYENKEWIYPYRENDRLGGYDPYSASKACAELAIHSYTQSFFNLQDFAHHQKAIASTRAGNVIGGGDWSADRIVPDTVRALRAGKPLVVRNPAAVRPWQHVLEPLGGYLLLGARLAENPHRYSGAWNFGPLADDNQPVEALVQTALKVWGSGTYETPVLTNQPHEAGLLKLDISKAITQLQWMPKYKAADAIRLTMEWYKHHQSNPDSIGEFTIRQIMAYMGLNHPKANEAASNENRSNLLLNVVE